MVILYSDDGILKQGSYESNKIKGRALLWDIVYNGQNIKFLDRIYCNADSDVELFKAYAKNKGWWRKAEQSMYPEAEVTLNGNEFTNDRFEIVLENIPEYFPYMDTMCFYVEEDGKCIITNDNSRGHIREFRCTGGNYIEIDNGRERGYSSPAENDGYLEDGECDMDEPVEVEMPIEDQLDEGECDMVEAPCDPVEDVIGVMAHQVPRPITIAADFDGTVSTNQAIDRMTRYTMDLETEGVNEITSNDIDRIHEILRSSSMIPAEYFGNFGAVSVTNTEEREVTPVNDSNISEAIEEARNIIEEVRNNREVQIERCEPNNDDSDFTFPDDLPF